MTQGSYITTDSVKSEDDDSSLIHNIRTRAYIDSDKTKYAHIDSDKTNLTYLVG